MKPDKDRQITKAVVVIPSKQDIDATSARYGGETLLGRSLVALSKSEICDVIVVDPGNQKNSIEKIIRQVRHRLIYECRIINIKSGDSLTETIREATASWTDPFILFDCGMIIHPTLISQMKMAHPARPVLFAFREVWTDKGQVRYSSGVKNKHKVMFQETRSYTQITMRTGDRDRILQSEYAMGNFDFAIENTANDSEGFFSTQILVCRSDQMKGMPFSDSVQGIIQSFRQRSVLQLSWVEPAWWLPVHGKTSVKLIKEFFWKIAFKEISGEFSKAVNSHLSKPMTFLLARLRFTPNVISVTEISLFVIASAFLFISEYWAMIAFALIWQLSAGVLDRCDGEVARMRNYESASGARFDMLIDDLRFAIPLAVLGYVCWVESSNNRVYPAALAATLIWYIPAALYQQYYMRKAGYVSIQALGVDLLKSLENEVSPDGFFNRFRFLMKGDIRTFYVFLLSFTGYKPVIFWVLVIYEWMVGLTNIITVRKMKRVMKNKLQSK